VRGFLSKQITVRSMLEHRGDIHHIFPRGYLKKDLGMRRSQYNQVANYVYTQQEINIAIGNQPPSIYMDKVKAQCNDGPRVYWGITRLEEMRENLSDNAIPKTLHEEVPEYEDFLVARRRLMAARLREYYFSL